VCCTCFYVPRVTSRRHRGDGQGRGSTVGRDQDPVGADGCSRARAQRGFQRRHAVQLDSGQTAHEARRVVALDEDGVDLPRFYNTHTHSVRHSNTNKQHHGHSSQGPALTVTVTVNVTSRTVTAEGTGREKTLNPGSASDAKTPNMQKSPLFPKYINLSTEDNNNHKAYPC